MQQASEGNFRIRVEQGGMDALRAEVRAGARRRDATIVGAVTLLGGFVWLAVNISPWPGVVLCAAGLITVLLARR